MEKSANDSWLAKVEIKDAIDGRAQIYIDGKLVHGVIGFKVEQNAADKRVPILTLQVQCQLDMDSGAIPLLPEPWNWFYQPKHQPFVDVRDIGKPIEKSKPFCFDMTREEAEKQLTPEEGQELERLRKAFKFSITADAEKREIAIALPTGESQLVLSEEWARLLIDQIEGQIQEWRGKP